MKIKKTKPKIKKEEVEEKIKEETIVKSTIENKPKKIARRKAKVEILPKEKVKYGSGSYGHKGVPGVRGGSAPTKNTRYGEINNYINSKMI